jgi:hypothetical protein
MKHLKLGSLIKKRGLFSSQFWRIESMVLVSVLPGYDLMADGITVTGALWEGGITRVDGTPRVRGALLRLAPSVG